MADDRNSGMNVPIPFRQIITKYSERSDWEWNPVSVTKAIPDVHIGLRAAFNSVPSVVSITVPQAAWWADPTVSDVWYTVWGDSPQITGGGEVEDLEQAKNIFLSSDWQNLADGMEDITMNFQVRVIRSNN